MDLFRTPNPRTSDSGWSAILLRALAGLVLHELGCISKHLRALAGLVLHELGCVLKHLCALAGLVLHEIGCVFKLLRALAGLVLPELGCAVSRLHALVGLFAPELGCAIVVLRALTGLTAPELGCLSFERTLVLRSTTVLVGCPGLLFGGSAYAVPSVLAKSPLLPLPSPIVIATASRGSVVIHLFRGTPAIAKTSSVITAASRESIVILLFLVETNTSSVVPGRIAAASRGSIVSNVFRGAQANAKTSSFAFSSSTNQNPIQ